MHRKIWPLCSLFVLLAFGLAVIGCADVGPAGTDARPVLLITVDGLTPSRVAAFGGDVELPRLAGLAQQGAAWPAALSASPMTRPAVATYLTGLAPDEHGVRDDVFSSVPGDVPTLAERAVERGYLTAAFPDSSFIHESSGLLRGFELVDRPPLPSRGPGRWLPLFKDAAGTAVPADWIRSLDEGQPWFAWVHLSYPLLGQFRAALDVGPAAAAGSEGEAAADPAAQAYEKALAEFDGQLGSLLDAVDSRGDGALVVLAGTMGNIREDRERRIPMGLGFSMDESAVEVALIVRAPQGVTAANTGGSGLAWSPDAAATVAAWIGVELDPRAEGVDLLGDALAARTAFSWSWAPQDQFGWHPLVLATDGSQRVVRAGERTLGDAEGDEALVAAIAGRRNVPVRRLPADVMDALVSEHGIELQPAAEFEAREFADPDARVEISARTWSARSYYLRMDNPRGHNVVREVTRKLDRENIAALVDRGHAQAFARNPGSKRLLGRALTLRPWDADIWHWYAHALLRSDLEVAEKILIAVQPYIVDQADVLYDLACTRSLLEDADASADYLKRAWDAGFTEIKKIEADPDLRHLKETGKLAEVLREVQ